jgi:hypothetical protein
MHKNYTNLGRKLKINGERYIPCLWGKMEDCRHTLHSCVSMNSKQNLRYMDTRIGEQIWKLGKGTSTRWHRQWLQEIKSYQTLNLQRNNEKKCSG